MLRCVCSGDLCGGGSGESLARLLAGASSDVVCSDVIFLLGRTLRSEATPGKLFVGTRKKRVYTLLAPLMQCNSKGISRQTSTNSFGRHGHH